MTRYSWPIPSLSERQLDAERPAGERWLLVGDAAGLVDPITREGLYFALASSTLAAESLMKDRAADRYIERVRRELHAELRTAARLKARFFHSVFTGLLLRALEDSARIRPRDGGPGHGSADLQGARRRLLLTGECRLAAEYLFRGRLRAGD